MKHRSKLLGGLAALASASLIAVGTVPANADPVRSYAATGSDTIQDVWNALTNDAGAVTALTPIASYNAFDSSGNAYPIQTKSGGAWFVRPSGSGEGIKSLSAAWNPDVAKAHKWTKAPTVPNGATGSSTAIVSTLDHEDVDFARSSDGPSGTGSDLTFIPFARDAVSVALKPATGLTTLDLTPRELEEIYTGIDDTSDSTVTFDAQPAAHVFVNGVEVHPQIPQNGSGTRKFFLLAVTGSKTYFDTASNIPAYIPNGNIGTSNPAALAENDGTVLTQPGDLIPFSAAQWIAQANGAPGVKNTTSGLVLAKVGGVDAVTGTAPSLAPGDLFGVSSLGVYNAVPAVGKGHFNRDTYDVIPASFRASGATSKQIALVSLLSTTLVSGAARNIIKTYGFGAVSYNTTTSTYGAQAFTN